MKKIVILGSTGSIGQSCEKVIKHLNSKSNSGECFRVVGLVANQNLEVLSRQIKTFNPEIVAVFEKKKAQKIQSEFPRVKVVYGLEGIEEVATYSNADLCVSALSGTLGIKPTILAIKSGKDIALANKEVLVSAGEMVMSLSKEQGVKIIPIDSEQSALFQCLNGMKHEDVSRLILTASGGPFFSFSKDNLRKVSIKDALNHPTWKMGVKNTIDSSTLMNKGLEVIEAYWLFNQPLDKIDVVIHPQSLVHSFVEGVDGSLLAQISENDMCIPIQYSLTFPKRVKGVVERFDFNKFSRFEFFAPDPEKFGCLKLAYESIKQGKSMPCFMNAANEVLVKRFVNEEISWLEITTKLEKLMESHILEPADEVDEILHIDNEAREKAQHA